MLQGHSIICFPPNRWDDIWRNRQQIMSRLARSNRVLYVHAPSVLRQFKTVWRQRGGHVGSELSSPAENLWVYEPPLYALRSGRKPLSTLTHKLWVSDLKRTMRRLGMSDPILWIFSYEYGDMIGHFDEQLRIYHAVDEYSAYELDYVDVVGSERLQRIRRMETELVDQVDQVFVTSPALYESKKSLHRHIDLVPNAVDYELFSRNGTGNSAPQAISNLPPPVIGYVGAINEKLDLALLRNLALARPNWQFLLVGPVKLRYHLDELNALKSLPNTHFVGRKTVEQLPGYMRACDVCLMPYKRNEWTRNISPLKLYEYLATGVPVVSTEIPAAQEFSDIVWLAADADAFVQAIANALAADTPERRRRQQNIARAHTWDDRVETLSTIIEQRLAAKNRPVAAATDT